MARRGLLPPAFRPRPGAWLGGPPTLRRAAAALLLFLVLWVTVFASLGLLGTTSGVTFRPPAKSQLFLVHAILLVTLLVWFGLAFVVGSDRGPRPRSSLGRQLGLRARSPAVELGLGLVCGAATWVVVISVLLVLGRLVLALGGRDALPSEPPPIVPWIASLPPLLRLAISASAGFAEELFFRGFLQPRVGIALSTALFALAHLSYDQPVMLVGVTLLSLAFAWIVRWRQSVWAAMVAHAVYNAIQLLFVIPWLLRYMESGRAGLVAQCVW